jgi:Conjugal transfer protein TraD.
MRKPRDFDAELRVLSDRSKALKMKRQSQLGELVEAAGAATLSIEQLAGALLDAGGADASRKEAWRESGADFFRTGRARARKEARRDPRRAAPRHTGPQSPSGDARLA